MFLIIPSLIRVNQSISQSLPQHLVFALLLHFGHLHLKVLTAINTSNPTWPFVDQLPLASSAAAVPNGGVSAQIARNSSNQGNLGEALGGFSSTKE